MNNTCEPCTNGRHIDCTAEAGDCTNICHPGFDPEVVVELAHHTENFGDEWAVYVRGVGRCYRTGTREQAEDEGRRILRGIEADERLVAR